jgi:tetratricopeptide (TPR) repeat protein
MAGGNGSIIPARDDVLDLLPLALARPREALARARAILDSNPAPQDACVAHQTAGIVLRDFGNVATAIRELRTALRLAVATGARERQADVQATLGIALIKAGRAAAGLASLDCAAQASRGAHSGRIRMRRGAALWVLGRHREALAELNTAAAALRRAGDPMWHARALTARALVRLALGATERADADFGHAERLFAMTSQDLELAYARHNRGLVAFRSGDLPAALAHFDEAAQLYQTLAAPMPDLTIDRCGVLLAAGLAADALREADLAICELERVRGQAIKKAELLLIAAGAALGSEDPATAMRRAEAACRLFSSQQRPWWHAHARLVFLEARYAAGMVSAALLRQAERTAESLEALGSGDAAAARLLAGRFSLALARNRGAERHLGIAARARRSGPALSRVSGWLAEALLAEALLAQAEPAGAGPAGAGPAGAGPAGAGPAGAGPAGAGPAGTGPAGAGPVGTGPVGTWPADAARAGTAQTATWQAGAGQTASAESSRRVLNACRRGFDALDEHRLTLGASELRAQATARGGELAELALRQALRAGSPRMLLFWSERWRATTLALPPVRPADDESLRSELSALRDATSRLEKAHAEGAQAPQLRREQARLEKAIRARVIRTRGPGRAGPAGFAATALLDELGCGSRLVQIVEASGVLHALVCGSGKVRRFTAGRSQDAAREVGFARFSLNRIAHCRGADRPERTLALLQAAGRRLEEVLLGRACQYLGDGPVVVVPPGRLHAVPWALLPSLRQRVLSVAPSSGAWMRARAAVPAGKDVVLVRGPGLGSQGAEVPALAAGYRKATVLGGGSATAPRVLEAIDGCLLAHIAAHGSFRADSPLFSSLRLDDGPLTVHDLERLQTAPHRLILPSCDSGLLAPTGADELLGLTSALIPLGTAGIVASVTRVNDGATVRLMRALHDRLRRGGTLSESLRDARCDLGDKGDRDLGDDPVQIATGWSFVALGSG